MQQPVKDGIYTSYNVQYCCNRGSQTHSTNTFMSWCLLLSLLSMCSDERFDIKLKLKGLAGREFHSYTLALMKWRTKSHPYRFCPITASYLEAWCKFNSLHPTIYCFKRNININLYWSVFIYNINRIVFFSHLCIAQFTSVRQPQFSLQLENNNNFNQHFTFIRT